MASTLTGVTTSVPNGIVALPQGILAVYSAEILHKALPAMRYEQFAVVKDELTRQPGTTITFTTYDNLPLGGTLTEGVDIVTHNLSASQASITVTEYGNAIAVTELYLQSSYDDVLTESAYELGRDYARVVDLMLRDTVAGATNTIWSGSAAGRTSTSAPLSVQDLHRCTEILYTNNVPKFNGDFFAAFIHPHQVTQLKRDPDWISAQNYANTQGVFLGELGRIDDVRFVATGHQQNGAVTSTDPAYDAALANAGAGSVDLYRAVIMGDSSYAWAIGLPVEMRDNGVQDFGRKHGLAWYSIMGSGILNNSNIVILETA